MATIKFIKSKKEYNIPHATDLVRVSYINPDIPLTFGCRNGDCGACAINVVEGQECLSKPTKEELKTLQKKGLPAGYRLACQCALMGNITIMDEDVSEPHNHPEKPRDPDNTIES